MEAKSIHVYPLIQVEKILKNEKLIRELLFGLHSANEGNKTFQISQASGSISFADYNMLWKNADPKKLPKDSRAAETAAMKFMQDKNRLFVKKGITTLFPLDPQTIDVIAVFSPNRISIGNSVPSSGLRLGASISGGLANNKGVPDHWLCRFSSRLSPGGFIPSLSSSTSALTMSSILVPEEPAPVLGIAIEIRIGAGGKVIGLKSYWRACGELPQIVSRFPLPSTDNVEVL